MIAFFWFTQKANGPIFNLEPERGRKGLVLLLLWWARALGASGNVQDTLKEGGQSKGSAKKEVLKD